MIFQSLRKNLTSEVHELSPRDIETPEGAGDRSSRGGNEMASISETGTGN